MIYDTYKAYYIKLNLLIYIHRITTCFNNYIMNHKTLNILLLLICAFFIFTKTQNTTNSTACSASLPDKNCLTCLNQTKCVTCKVGYFKGLVNCELCPSGCSDCTLDLLNKLVCKTCTPPGILSDDKTCFICSSICLTCSKKPQNCSSCAVGYSLQIVDLTVATSLLVKTCKKTCVDPCLTCNGTRCLSCSPEKYLANGTCITCAPPCVTCSSKTYCLTGPPGTRVANGSVVACNKYCTNCSSTVCLSCPDGTYISGMDCLPCNITICRTCKGNPNTCTSCQPPAIFNGTGCTLCNAQCLNCTANPNVCTVCRPPFSSVPINGVCKISTVESCKTVSTESASKCIECIDQYMITTDSTCVKCPNNCRQCAYNANIPKKIDCIVCADKTAINKNLVCIPCLSNCLSCTISDLNQNQTICTSPAPGKFLTGDGKVMVCPSGCSNCTDAKTCTATESGKVMSNGVIINLLQGCATTLDPSKFEKCSTCLLGYFLSGTSCKKCIADCQKCTNATQCTQCLPNINLVANKCVKCDKNCLTCDATDNKKCLSCPQGTILVGSICTSCLKNCLQCDPNNRTICLKAAIGYAVNQAFKIIKCFSSCGGACNPIKPNQCLNAPKGYELINNKVIKCAEGVSVCKQYIPVECEDRYKLVSNTDGSNFTCQKVCKFPCATCTSNDVCTGCENNFIFDSTTNTCAVDVTCGGVGCSVMCPYGSYRDNVTQNCIKCALANCTSCSSTECFDCQEGFYYGVADLKCLTCPTNCSRCKDENLCQVCSPGFFRKVAVEGQTIATTVYEPTCTPCGSPCLTCYQYNTTCKSCITGYRINGSICISNKTIGMKFELNVDPTKFISTGLANDFIDKLCAALGKSQLAIIINYLGAKLAASKRLLQATTLVVEGSVSLDSTDNPAALSSMASQSISDQFPGTLLSSSVALQNQNGQVIQETSKTKIQLIVGVVVGGFVFLIVVLSVVYVLIIKPKAIIPEQPSAQRLDDIQVQSLEMVEVKRYKRRN